MIARWWGAISESDVPELAEAILDPRRQQPIIVVTTANYTTPERIPQATLDEAEAIREAVGDIADAAIVATGGISFALEAELPDYWHIFGGACRSYPAGILADPDNRRAPLRRRRSSEKASEQLINDALGHAHAAGLFEEKPQASVETTGKVTGFLLDGEQALVDVGARMPALVWRDMTSPGIPLDWILEKGLEVHGELDQEHNRFGLRLPAFGAAEFHQTFPHGAVTLALVDRVEPDNVALRVHPNLSITVPRSEVSSNPLDLLDLFFVEGEVVRARVVHLSSGEPHLRLIDIDDDEPLDPAIAVVEGGVPWLVEGRVLPTPAETPLNEPTPDEVAPAALAFDDETAAAGDDLHALKEALGGEASPEPEPEPTPIRPVPGPGLRPAAPKSAPRPQAPPQQVPSTAGPPKENGGATIRSMSITIDALRAENDRLRREAGHAKSLHQELELTRHMLRDTRVDLGEAQNQVTHLKGLHKQAVEKIRSQKKPQPAPARVEGPRDRQELWPNDEMWVRNEIELAWRERVNRSDKLNYPLPEDYLLGPGFTESLGSLNDDQFDKAMKCVVDVLIDRAKDIKSRDLHRLRTGNGGSDAPVIRSSDGAVAWRAAVEINAASARRLHFWLIGSQVELSQVAIHDNMDA